MLRSTSLKSLTSLILFWSLSTSIQAYDWRNDDPSLADPGGAITCDNILPPFYTTPIARTEDAGEPLTLLKICAEEQYGGQPFRWGWSTRQTFNMGAFCDEKDGRIAFQEARPYDEAYLVMIQRRPTFRLRFAAYCKLRCKCSNVPSSDLEPISFREQTEESGVIIRLDVLKDSDIRYSYREQRSFHRHQRLLGLSLVAHYMRTEEQPEFVIPQDWVGVDQENAIACSTNSHHMPAFDLPEPAIITDFANLIELCAVGLLGGKPTMNAGAFCHRDFGETSREVRSADVWFSDEMTPLPNWMWSYRAVLLRQHCWRYCRCKDPRWKDRKPNSSLARIWPYLNGEIQKSQRYPSFSEKGDSESTTSSQGTSGGTMSQQSLQKDLKSLQGFLPDWAEKRLDATQGVADPQTCDDKCNGPRDCIAKSSASCPYQAQCRVDPRSLTQTVIGSLTSVSLTYAAFACLPKQTRSRLGGRDVEARQAMVADNWPCACNMTYVSHACCRSDTGQIWEASSGFMGILRT